MKKRLLMLLFPLVLLLAPAFALAQSAPAKTAAGDEGWQPVSGDMTQPESFRAPHLVAAAYGFIWLMVAGFVYGVWRRTQAVEREIDALKKRIEQGAPSQSGSHG